MIVTAFVVLLIFISVTVLLILAEAESIKRRKKWEWILPLIVTAAALILIVPNAQETSSGPWGTSLNVQISESRSGELNMVWKDRGEGRGNEVLAVGFLEVGKGENRQYLDVELRNGKLIGGKEALKYKEAVEESVSWIDGDYTGKTVSYEELQQAAAEASKPQSEFTWHAFGILCLYFAPAPLILWSMYLISCQRRKRRQRVTRTRLEDL
ncbi:MAG: hypothetical protein ACI4LA_07140 [Emergencia sp.]